jgi:hypothetical protein
MHILESQALQEPRIIRQAECPEGVELPWQRRSGIGAKPTFALLVRRPTGGDVPTGHRSRSRGSIPPSPG